MNKRRAEEIIRRVINRKHNITTSEDILELTSALKSKLIKIGVDTYIIKDDPARTRRLEYFYNKPYLIAEDAGIVFTRDYDVDLDGSDILIQNDGRVIGTYSGASAKYASLPEVVDELRMRISNYRYLPENMFVDVIIREASKLCDSYINSNKLYAIAAHDNLKEFAAQDVAGAFDVLKEKVDRYEERLIQNAEKRFPKIIPESRAQFDKYISDLTYAKKALLDGIEALKNGFIKSIGSISNKLEVIDQYAEVLEFLSNISFEEVGLSEKDLGPFKIITSDLETLKANLDTRIKDRMQSVIGEDEIVKTVKPIVKKKKDKSFSGKSGTVLSMFRKPNKLFSFLLTVKTDLIAPVFSKIFSEFTDVLIGFNELQALSPDMQAEIKNSLEDIKNNFLAAPNSFKLDPGLSLGTAEFNLDTEDIFFLLEASFQEARATLLGNQEAKLYTRNPLTDFAFQYGDSEDKFHVLLRETRGDTASDKAVFDAVKSIILDKKLYFKYSSFSGMDSLIMQIITDQKLLDTITSVKDISTIINNIESAISAMYSSLLDIKGINYTGESLSEEAQDTVGKLTEGLGSQFRIKNKVKLAPYNKLLKMLFGSIGDISDLLTLIDGSVTKAEMNITELNKLMQGGPEGQQLDDPRIQELREAIIKDAFLTSALYSKAINIVGMNHVAHVGTINTQQLPQFKKTLIDSIIAPQKQYAELDPKDKRKKLSEIYAQIDKYAPSMSSNSNDLYKLALLFNSHDLDNFFQALESAKKDPKFMFENKGGKRVRVSDNKIFKRVIETIANTQVDNINKDLKEIVSATKNTQNKFNAYMDKNSFMSSDGVMRFTAMGLKGKAFKIFMSFMVNNNVKRDPTSGGWVVTMVDPKSDTVTTVSLDEYQDKYMDAADNKALGMRLSDIIKTAYEPMITAARQEAQPGVIFKAVNEMLKASPALQERLASTAILGHKSISSKIHFELLQSGTDVAYNATTGVVGYTDVVSPMYGLSGKSTTFSDPARSAPIDMFPDKLINNLDNYTAIMNKLKELGAEDTTKSSAVTMFFTLKEKMGSFLAAMGSGAPKFLRAFSKRLQFMKDTLYSLVDDTAFRDIILQRKKQLSDNRKALENHIKELELFVAETGKSKESTIKKIEDQYLKSIDDMQATMDRLLASKDITKENEKFKDYLFNILMEDLFNNNNLTRLMKAHSGGQGYSRYRKPTASRGYLGKIIQIIGAEEHGDNMLGTMLHTMKSMENLLSEAEPVAALSSLFRVKSEKTAAIKRADEFTQVRVNKLIRLMGGLPKIYNMFDQVVNYKLGSLERLLQGTPARLRQFVNISEVLSSPDPGALATQYFKAMTELATGSKDILSSSIVKNFSVSRMNEYKEVLTQVSEALPKLREMTGTSGVRAEEWGQWAIERARLSIKDKENEIENLSAELLKIKDPDKINALRDMIEHKQTELLTAEEQINNTQDILDKLAEDASLDVRTLDNFNNSYFASGFLKSVVPSATVLENKEKKDKMSLVMREASLLEKSYTQLMVFLKKVMGLDYDIIERFLTYYNTIEIMVLRYFSETSRLLKSGKIMELTNTECTIADQRLRTTFKARFTRASRMAAPFTISPYFLSGLYSTMEELGWFGKDKDYYVNNIKERNVSKQDAVELIAGVYYMLWMGKNKLEKVKGDKADLLSLNSGMLSDSEFRDKVSTMFGIAPEDAFTKKTQAILRRELDKYLLSKKDSSESFIRSRELVDVSPVDIATFYSHIIGAEELATRDNISIDQLISEAKVLLDKNTKGFKDMASKVSEVGSVEKLLEDSKNFPNMYSLVTELLSALYEDKKEGAKRSVKEKDELGLETERRERVAIATMLLDDQLNTNLLDNPTAVQVGSLNIPWVATTPASQLLQHGPLNIKNRNTNRVIKLTQSSGTISSWDLTVIEEIFAEARTGLSDIVNFGNRELKLALLNLSNGGYKELESFMANYFSSNIAPYLFNISFDDEEETSELGGSTSSVIMDDRLFPTTQIILEVIRYIPYMVTKESEGVLFTSTAKEIASKFKKQVINATKYGALAEKLPDIIYDLLVVGYDAYLNLRESKSFATLAPVFFSSPVPTVKNTGKVKASYDTILMRAGTTDTVLNRGLARLGQSEDIITDINDGALLVITDTAEDVAPEMQKVLNEYVTDSLNIEEVSELSTSIITALKNINNILGG